jgi:hypothetical protein
MIGIENYLDKKYNKKIEMSMKDAHVKKQDDFKVYFSFLSFFSEKINAFLTQTSDPGFFIPLIGLNSYPSDVKEMILIAAEDAKTTFASKVAMDTVNDSKIYIFNNDKTQPIMMENSTLRIIRL